MSWKQLQQRLGSLNLEIQRQLINYNAQKLEEILYSAFSTIDVYSLSNLNLWPGFVSKECTHESWLKVIHPSFLSNGRYQLASSKDILSHRISFYLAKNLTTGFMCVDYNTTDYIMKKPSRTERTILLECFYLMFAFHENHPSNKQILERFILRAYYYTSSPFLFFASLDFLGQISSITKKMLEQTNSITNTVSLVYLGSKRFIVNWPSNIEMYDKEVFGKAYDALINCDHYTRLNLIHKIDPTLDDEGFKKRRIAIAEETLDLDFFRNIKEIPDSTLNHFIKNESSINTLFSSLLEENLTRLLEHRNVLEVKHYTETNCNNDDIEQFCNFIEQNLKLPINPKWRWTSDYLKPQVILLYAVIICSEGDIKTNEVESSVLKSLSTVKYWLPHEIIDEETGEIQDCIHFGKYKGNKFVDINSQDPAYVYWAATESDSIIVPPNLLLDCHNRIAIKKPIKLLNGVLKYLEWKEWLENQNKHLIESYHKEDELMNDHISICEPCQEIGSCQGLEGCPLM